MTFDLQLDLNSKQSTGRVHLEVKSMSLKGNIWLRFLKLTPFSNTTDNICWVRTLNCNTRSFNNQVNKIFVEHFTWLAVISTSSLFIFLQNLTTTQNRPTKLSLREAHFKQTFRFYLFSLFSICTSSNTTRDSWFRFLSRLDSNSSRQSTYFLWFAKIFRPNSLHHYHHHQL